MENNGSMACTVKIAVFEGPLDLLLHLIRKNEIDIYDIPMALITEQYLEYLRWMESLNLDIASEYLVMAATLVHIKSRMILPAPEDAEEDEDADGAEDPRAELVRRLLEYQKYKEAAQRLGQGEIMGRDVFARPAEIPEPYGRDDFPREASLFDLIEAFRTVMASRKWDGISLEVDLERIRLADRIQEIADALERSPHGIGFDELFSPSRSRMEIVVTFLALLEMIRLGMVKAYQTLVYGTIRIVRAVEVSDPLTA